MLAPSSCVCASTASYDPVPDRVGTLPVATDYPAVVALRPDDVERLDQRARQVGAKIGWALAFCQAPNPEFVGMTADTIDEDIEPHHIFVFGPTRVDGVTVHEVDLLLDDLECGARRIIPDEDGDPRLA